MMVEITMTFNRFRVDENYKPFGYPQFVKIRGINALGINAEVQALRDRNDLSKWTPWNFVRMDSVEVI